MIQKTLRWILWAGVAGLVGAGLLAYWFISLFTQLDMVTAQRVLNKPAVYYSDITTLRHGQMLTPGGLSARLRARGYREEKDRDPAEGGYRFLGDWALEVFFRPFIAPDGRAVAGLYQFSFASATLTAIEQFPSRPVKEGVILEPLRFGDTRVGGAELSPWVRLERVPSYLKAAVLDAEDRRFYAHHGIDVIGVTRAFLVNVIRLSVRQGGSTLTQQLVRNAFLSQERTFARKITEAAIALIIELRYDKDRIFELYLNQIYLGKNGLHTVYGVEDASMAYFGKHVTDLSLSECAILAGMIPSPNRRNPRVNPAETLERRNRAIQMLLKNKRITPAEAQGALRELPVYAPVASQGTGSYYVDWVRQLLEAEYGGAALESRGYIVYTALDPEVQEAAEKALASQKFEGAVVAMDAYTGHVRALAGGRDFGTSPFNRAVLAKRSPGSAFKPIIYAAGLELKYFKPDSLLEDKPLTLTVAGKKWEPRNYDGTYWGDTSYRDALVFSRNIPAVQVLRKIGAARAAAFAGSMGIRSALAAVPSLALGASGVTPLEMTAAYAPLANGGDAVEPLFIRWVTDSSGRVIEEHTPARTKALSAKTASLMTDMLEDVVNRGTGRGVRAHGYTGRVAGKTGTSDHFRDAWFVGYTPTILCGVWLGNDDNSSLGSSAAEIAVPVWTAFIQAVPDPGRNGRFGSKEPTGIRGFFFRLFGKKAQ